MMEDLVIIGAGIHGLVMLKTYLDVHPDAKVVVLDKDSSLGGVWSKNRLYPGLRTNNHFQTFEFSGFPMETHGFDLADDHIPGEHVNLYLHQYAKRYGLMKHIRFDCDVESASDKGDAGWVLTVKHNLQRSSVNYEMATKRLIVATGLTSEPFMPLLDGKDTFDAPIYHTSEFAKAENGLGPFKNVVVMSGSKYCWDVVCAYATSGIKVDWVIRESGHGPYWMFPNRLTPLKIIPELLVQTRLMTWLSPSIFNDGFTWIRHFFQKSWLGRKIVDAFFHKMQHGVEVINDYDGHPETAKLRPWDDVFFIGTNRGLLNYEVNFFDLVRSGQIRVHIADIARLSHHKVHLASGLSLDADVLICGTGWKDTPPLNFMTEKELGLPGHRSSATKKYIAQADAEILETCPKLQNQPASRCVKPMTDKKVEIAPEPYRLYRFMVPPAFIKSRTLAFAGAYRSPATMLIAQAQALWITAFFDDRIPILNNPDSASSEQIMYETVLHTQFAKWRYSRGFGARFPEIWFDCIPYMDLILKDIGVRNQRKKSWWAERFTPYMPADYVGIVEEYLKLKDKRV